MSERDFQVTIGCYDQGTSCGKPAFLQSNKGEIKIESLDWSINSKGNVDLPEGDPPIISSHPCWYGDLIVENLTGAKGVLKPEHNLNAASGATGRDLAVIGPNGELLAIFLENSLASVPISNDAQIVFNNPKYFKDRVTDNRQVRKIAAVLNTWDSLIAPRLKLGDIKANDLYFLPLTSAILHYSLNLSLNTLGWTIADARGITSGDDDLVKANDILGALGLRHGDHFKIQEQEVLTLSPDRHLALGGDFQTNLKVIDAFCRGEQPFIDGSSSIFVELDSVLKFFKLRQNKKQIPALNKSNGMDISYGLVRDGAGVSNYLMQLCAPELQTLDKSFYYQYLNDLAAKYKQTLPNNPFIFIPNKDTDQNGKLYLNSEGIWHRVNFEQLIGENEQTKGMIADAVYLSVGCVSREVIGEETQHLIAYGGYYQANQLDKMAMFLGCLSPNTTIEILIMPNCGILTGLLGLKQIYGNHIDISKKIDRVPLGNGGQYGWYYDHWKAACQEIRTQEG